ncbi:hypothetical protein SCP_1301740 [Sparassis crispa]|uniref:Uncharacterized protein n=1 Tax=Sparassis crispa TaxID=139825 RepID=A0A401H1U0_9APHY|nr:hypothetical protein SCP_1301740 [Sparassis crispa]GBE88359.1 hypothetical protein SCP_1301740 [Sparassis crispa]
MKDPTVEHVRTIDRSSPKDQDSSGPPAVAKRQVRDKPQERERDQSNSIPKMRDCAQMVSSQLPVHDSDSTFSPSSTPFPGPGYNPWDFIPTAAGHPNMGGGSAMSIHSSLSHESIHLPPPPLAMRGRGLRRRDQTVNLRQ